MNTPIQDVESLRPSWNTSLSGMASTGGSPVSSDNSLLTELEGDIPSLANQAATELDDLVIGRGSQTSAIRQFAAFLKSELTSPGASTARRMPVRATTLVVMNRAISDANIGSSAKQVGEIVEQVAQVAESLQKVAETPTQYQIEKPGEFERLRAFCVAYSKSFSASERPRSDRPRHPFRR